MQALSQWCLRGVHRPNVRSERRPTTEQLVVLHDHCHEFNISNNQALQDAVQYFVESGGGRWPTLYDQPLKYKKRRKYIRSDDPLGGVQLPPLATADEACEVPDVPSNFSQSRTGWADLPGLPPSADALDLPVSDTPLVVASTPALAHRSQKKPSGPSLLLTQEESTVRVWVTTRKGPRPRRPRDIGLPKHLRKDMPRAPFWLQGGWEMRPKYQPGRKRYGRGHCNYPYTGVPVGKRGAAWVLRR